MSVTSAPIGSTGQSLDGFSVDANVLQAFRESVVITDPTDSTGAAPVSSTYGLTVNVASTVAQVVNVSTTVTVTGANSTQIISSIPFYVAQSSAPWTINGGVEVSSNAQLSGTSQIFGSVSTQIVSSIPFYVSQSTNAWQVQATNTISTQTVSSIPLIVAQSTTPWVVSGSTQIVSSIPFIVAQSTTPWVMSGSTQIVSSLPLFVTQSSAPWSMIGAINVSSHTAVASTWALNTTMTNVVSSIPYIVAQSTNPWTVSGSTQVVSSIPFFVAQSSAPWSVVQTVSTAGGATATTIVCVVGLNSTVIKSSAGQIYGYALSNFGGSPVFVKVCNTTQTGPASTQPLVFMAACGVSTAVTESLGQGVPFSQGITIYTVINPFAPGAGTTGVLSSSVTLTLLFK